MSALPAGRYAITVTATDTVGERSPPDTVKVVVPRRR
jgi:hypothetical protein